MNIKKTYKFGKIIFYSLVSVPLITLGIYVLLNNVILSSNVLNNLEYNDMKSKIHQSQSILNTKVEELERIAKDYGIWEECYNKAQEKDTAWFKENFSDWIPSNFGIDLILVTNRNKEILNQYGISESNFDLLSDEFVVKMLSNKHKINDESFTCGFKIYNKQLYIFGISPILRGYDTEDVQGIVIIGKKVTQEFIADINKQFDVRMLLKHNDNFISSNQDYIILEKYLEAMNNTNKDVTYLGKTAITASTKLLDISSNEIGKLIVLESPRTFLNAVNLMRLYSILVLLLCTIIVFILSLQIKKYIESPINKLTNQIHQMADEDKILMMDSSGPYEIIRLADAFNNLLVKLRMKQEENLVLKNSSNTDGLTFLYNKKFFLESIKKITLDKDPKFNLLFCDIDYFKKVNDQYGHQIGDMVLKEISSIINKTIDGKGQAFRYGGEEFAIMLYYMETPFNIAEEIRVLVSSSITLKRICPKLNITISIGIASYPEHTRDVNNLIRKADIAMYYCKKNGRNQCQVFKNYMETDLPYLK